MTTPWIDAKGIHTFYGSSHILHGIDFTVGQGETIGLMGRNGMGCLLYTSDAADE